jgi:hypothetical protein
MTTYKIIGDDRPCQRLGSLKYGTLVSLTKGQAVYIMARSLGPMDHALLVHVSNGEIIPKDLDTEVRVLPRGCQVLLEQEEWEM